MKTLHIFNDPKFSVGYFKFLAEQGFNLTSHSLFHYRTRSKDASKFPLSSTHSPSFFSIFPNLRLLHALFKADKIIIHCLASPFLVFYLFLFPSLCRKCYWVIWGKDLYLFHFEKNKRPYHHLYELFRKRVIYRIPFVVSNNEVDLRNAKEWYGLNARVFPSFSYPSNLYRSQPAFQQVPTDRVRILLGNSADPSNNHEVIFERIEAVKVEKVDLFVPLSYGSKEHCKHIIDLGESIFADRFHPLTESIPLKDYVRFLASIDIAVFAHERQQAVGTINTLIGFGKKVYLSKNSSVRDQLEQLGIKVFDLSNFDLSPIPEKVAEKNMAHLQRSFSPSELKSQWVEIFEYWAG